MARGLGFVELVDFAGHDEIALSQAVDLVRPGCDLDSSPGKEDVRVVPLLFRKLTYSVHKLECVALLKWLARCLFGTQLQSPILHCVSSNWFLSSLKVSQIRKSHLD